MATRYRKAYIWHDEDEGNIQIVWDYSANHAKSQISHDNSIPYISVSVRRAPWADDYDSMEDIPPHVYWENGVGCYCSECGVIIYEGEGEEKEGKAYCTGCYDWVTGRL